MITRRQTLQFAAAALGGLAVGSHAKAAAYPTRPIKLIVPFSPGGSTDLVGRLLARELPKHLGQSLVVENRPGAGSMIGLNEIVEARPDGYTIGMTNSALVTQPLYGIARHNYATELTALAQVGEVPFVLAVKADAPWKTLEEFIAYGRENPNKIKYGITGYGNTAHIGPEHLKLEAKMQIEPVNFDGGGPLIAALLGGHIHAAGNNPVDLKEHVKAGRVRILVIFGEQRLQDPLFSEIPTAKELGYNVVVTLWQAVSGPKNLPPEIRTTLNDALSRTINDPAVQNAIRDLGLEPVYLDADALQRKFTADQEKMRRVVTDTGILEVVRQQIR